MLPINWQLIYLDYTLLSCLRAAAIATTTTTTITATATTTARAQTTALAGMAKTQVRCIMGIDWIINKLSPKSRRIDREHHDLLAQPDGRVSRLRGFHTMSVDEFMEWAATGDYPASSSSSLKPPIEKP